MSTRRFRIRPVEDPWLSFLRAVDEQLQAPVEIHCVGGFALQLLVEHARPTGDVDIIETVPSRAEEDLRRIAGERSTLAAEFKLHLQAVGVADAPSDYAGRLLDATPDGFGRLTIKVLDPYDLILTKVQRNSPRDLEDARALVAQLGLDGEILRTRFDDELEPHLAVAPDRAGAMFDLWMEELFGMDL